MILLDNHEPLSRDERLRWVGPWHSPPQLCGRIPVVLGAHSLTGSIAPGTEREFAYSVENFQNGTNSSTRI